MEILDLREAGEDGGDLMGYYAKGHLDKASFVAAVREYSGIDSYSDYKCCKEELVTHTYWRTVPMRGQDGCSMFLPAKEGTPGAWAVTAFEYAGSHAFLGFEREKELIAEGRDRGQREAINFAYRWIHAVKGAKSAEEFLAVWNTDRVIKDE